MIATIPISPFALFQAAEQIMKMYKFFIDVDATQVEINPFGETPDGQVVSFDAKINFDDNAKFRQQEVSALDRIHNLKPQTAGKAH